MASSSSPAWRAAHASVIGSGHITAGIPCQDASLARVGDRPCLIVCDGRGSAKHSDAGAQAAVHKFAELAEDAAPMLSRALDADDASETEAARAWAHFAQLAYASLGNVTRRLADTAPGTKPSDYDFTLVAAVTGHRRLGWIHVGDGFLVLERHGKMEALSAPENGEFANQTHFVRPNGEGLAHLRQGVADLAGVSGIAAVSDGCEPLLWDTRTGLPAEAFSQVLAELRSDSGSLRHRQLLDLPDWENCTRDDRSLALLSRRDTPLSRAPAAEASPREVPATTSSPLAILPPTPITTRRIISSLRRPEITHACLTLGVFTLGLIMGALGASSAQSPAPPAIAPTTLTPPEPIEVTPDFTPTPLVPDSPRPTPELEPFLPIR